MTTNIENTVYFKKINLDIPAIKQSCEQLREVVVNNFEPGLDHLGKPMSGYFNSILETDSKAIGHYVFRYNALLYPFDQFHELYEEIRSAFIELNPNYYNEKYYMMCWLNIHHKGEHVNWHRHRAHSLESWHGVFYVDCEPSHITYRFDWTDNEYDIPCNDNTLIIGKNAGSEHRTWPWDGDTPRINIAFSMVPRQDIEPGFLNFWMPV